MHLRSLGRSGLSVSALGLGCMGMSEFYGPSDDEESLATLVHAFERGVTFYDTADTYGHGHNETLLGRFLQSRRESVVVATKCGIFREKNSYARAVINTPEYIRSCCDASLQRLGVDVIDLFYIHRMNLMETPLEDSIGALADLVKSGKVRAIGLCELSPGTLRKAHAIHPIAALQSEYSLWTRDPEQGVLEACRELGVAFVAYSPLGRGFLTGTITETQGLAPGDFRAHAPRFNDENLNKNLERLALVRAIADAHSATPGQIALAWLLAQGEDVIPIPGTRKQTRIDENVGAADIQLSSEDLANLSAAFPAGGTAGDRYTAEGMKGVNV